MKILYLAHRVPFPPNKGDKIRSFNTIKHLGRHHDLWCACFVDDPRDLPHLAALREYCRDVTAIPLHPLAGRCRALRSLAAGRSATEGYYRDDAMWQAVRQLGERIGFDAVLVFSSGMAQYAEAVDAPRKVIDLCDLDSRKWGDYAARRPWPASSLLALEARRVADLEMRCYRKFDATVLIGEHETADWPLVDRSKLHVVRNGVDVPDPVPDAYETGIVGFVGDMSYYPNADAMLWFARHAWPRIWRAAPWARCQIVGRHPSRALRRLARREGIEVVGETPDVRAYVSRFQVAVVPLRIARGLQNKVLEAMAAARAVVLTPPAAAGIQGTSGVNLQIAEGDAIADRVIDLLCRPSACADLGRAARDHVARSFSWPVEMLRLNTLLMHRTVPPLVRPRRFSPNEKVSFA